MQIELIPAAPEQEQVVANLLELYAYDFSDFHDIEIRSDGKFGYRDLPLYWHEPNRHPFLIKVDSKLAGFVLVKRGSDMSRKETAWDVAEFFVLRRYRKRGIGTEAAHELWRRFPGLWQVRVMQSNSPALHFWKGAIARFTGKNIESLHIEKDGQGWHLFSFESSHENAAPASERTTLLKLLALRRLGNTLGNNRAYLCLLVTTKRLGKPLKPLICGSLIENQ